MDEAVRSTELRRDEEGVVRHGGEWLALWADPDSVRSAAARGREARERRRHEAAQRSLAAAIRSIAGRPDLAVDFGGDPGLRDGRCHLPTLARPVEAGDLAALRGLGDAMALRLRFHDARLHARLAPEEPRRRRLFDALEAARCDAMGARLMPGVRLNLDSGGWWQLARHGLAGARLAAEVPAALGLHLVARDALAGEPATRLPSPAIEMWDRWIRARLGGGLADLSVLLGDQAAFAARARAFVEDLAAALELGADGPEPSLPLPEVMGADAADDEDAPSAEELAEGEERAPGEGAGRRPPLAPAAPARAYAAFTTAHDRVVAPEDLCPPAELLALRAKLDEGMGDLRRLLATLAHRLQRRILALQRRAWEFDLEEGLLDAARLDRVVVNPGSALSFKQERDAEFRDTVVTLLVDCSGSMRGRPILLAGMAADITARALERCGIKCEVLGFTTAAWGGGASLRDWARAGRPPRPGRVSDLLHVVLKAADVPYARGRAGLGLLLKPGLLKENVDGEAVQWAAGRLLRRHEARRILVVVSDGAPADETTAKHNGPDLLDRHLAEVVRRIEAEGRIELAAIGIGHDVSRHYRRAVTIPDAERLGPTLLAQLGGLFERG